MDKKEEYYDMYYANFYGFEHLKKEFRADGWFHGKASDYLKAKGEIIRQKPKNCLMHQMSSCYIAGAMKPIQYLKDSAIIIHGPTGCGCHMYLECAMFQPMKEAICTQMDEHDAIMGGNKKLREAIEEAIDRFQPGVIGVIETCVSSIIGDDIQGICETMEKKSGIPIIALRGSGFKFRTWNLGVDASFNLLIDRMKKVDEKNKDSINFLNFSVYPQHYKEVYDILPYLTRLGIKINTNTPFLMTFQEMIEKFPRAELNVVRCPGVGLLSAEYAEKRLGIPYLRFKPVSLRYTEEFVRGLATFFGCLDEAENLIREEKERIRDRLERVKSRLKGKRVAINTGPGKNMGLAQLLTELGMEVVYLGPLKTDSTYHQRLGEFLESSGQDPELLAEPSAYETEAVMSRLKPDLFIGMPEDRRQTNRLGILSLDILSIGIPLVCGFEAVATIGEYIVAAFENKLLNNWSHYLWSEYPPYASEKFMKKSRIDHTDYE